MGSFHDSPGSGHNGAGSERREVAGSIHEDREGPFLPLDAIQSKNAAI